MTDKVAWVDGWEVRTRPDGSYGVNDDHSMLAGPFGRKDEAIAAAMKLPHPEGVIGIKRPQLGRPADA